MITDTIELNKIREVKETSSLSEVNELIYKGWILLKKLYVLEKMLS